MIAASPEKRLSVSSNSSATQPIPKKSLQIRTDKPRPHLCSTCTRGFARLEHLKRHERSHTNEKPFQCAACGRCFARRDLVLRHQQKLHSKIFQVARRGSLPATLSAQSQKETMEAVANDNIIVLSNNTKNTAPLPNQSQTSSPFASGEMSNSAASSPSHMSSHHSPMSGNSHSRHAGKQRSIGAGINQHPIPSPNTNSSQNTPSFSSKHGNLHGYSDADPLSNSKLMLSDYIQQPSPLTGDSPDYKDKYKPSQQPMNGDFISHSGNVPLAQDFINSARFNKSQHSTQRHASFSAVSGLSYTNLQDALAIKNNQLPEAPQQVGFATPQLDSHDLENRGLSILDFGGLDLDWYSLDFGANPDQADAPSRVLNSRRKDANGSDFKMKLNTIPSESRLDGKNKDYFTGAMQWNQFNDPNHPHHIKGTTPLEFNFPPTEPPVQTTESRDIDFNSNLTEDIMNLQKERTQFGAPETAVQKTPQGKSKRSQTPEVRDFKKQKIGFVNEIDDLDWIEQLKGIPVSNDFPSASTKSGFLGMPYIADEYQNDGVFSLFRHRQDDLVKQRSRSHIDTKSLFENSIDGSGSETSRRSISRRNTKASFTIGESNDFITEELRDKIVEISKLTDEQFPPLNDLNSYMKLYDEEFNTYYSFIHMHTLKTPMVDNFENIPLILSMCAIGALYSYHDSNTLLLFNLSKYHIHNFFENEVTVDKLQFKKVPIMAHQCLVLHIFISMFLNEPNMVEITSRQMKSMVGLIKSTNFHRPLEQFLVPPPPIEHPNDVTVLQNNYDYFIMAQTRIRTIHTFYQMEVLRSALLGCPLPLSGSDIMSGSYCNNDELWQSGDAAEWYSHYVKNKKSIVELSNNEDMNRLVDQLDSIHVGETKHSYNKSLALLMYVHEQISKEYASVGDKSDPLAWRWSVRPKLDSLVKSWEAHFIRNGGFSIVNNKNHHLLNSSSELKLILPLSLLAKIRTCVNFTKVTAAILYKDWDGMINSLDSLQKDVEALKEASQYAIDILNLWVHNISLLSDAKQTSVRTPVFFVTAVFISVMILNETLVNIENSESLSYQDKAIWINCNQVLKSIESALSPKEESSYSEFLREQSQGIFDYVLSKKFKQHVDNVCLNIGKREIAVEEVKQCKLSTQALAIGVRILADAPLWPLAMGFAEALKNVAIHMNKAE